MPEPPTHNALRIVSDTVLAFCNNVGVEMLGDYPHREWDNTWKRLCGTLLDGLLSLKPTTKVAGKLDEGIFAAINPGKTVDNFIVINSEDEEDVPMQDPETPQKKRKVEDNVSTPMRPPPGRFQTPSIQRRQASRLPTDFSHLRRSFQLDEFGIQLQDASRSRIPDQLDPKVIDDLILANIEHWGLPTSQFFKDLERELNNKIQLIFHEHFKMWQDSGLYREASTIIEALLKQNLEAHRKQTASDCLDDERKGGPFVYNHDDFDIALAKEREYYRNSRRDSRMKTYGKEMFEETGCQFTMQEKDRLNRDPVKRALLESEPYNKEIAAITQVTTYYMWSAKRFRQALCSRISSKLLRQLANAFRIHLENGLGIFDNHNGKSGALTYRFSLTHTGAEKAARLLAESASRAKQREKLTNTLEALQNGLEHLGTLQGVQGIDSSSSLTSFDGLPAKREDSSSFGPASTSLADEMVDVASAYF